MRFNAVRFDCTAMTLVRRMHWRVAAATVGAALLGACAIGQPAAPLKEVPGAGTVPRGDVVYVDDGRCPAGQLTKITGGSQKTGVARQTECVKRPDNL